MRPFYRLICAGLVALLASAPGRGQPAECSPDAELTYLCGLQKPEDLLAVPGTS